MNGDFLCGTMVCKWEHMKALVDDLLPGGPTLYKSYCIMVGHSSQIKIPPPPTTINTIQETFKPKNYNPNIAFTRWLLSCVLLNKKKTPIFLTNHLDTLMLRWNYFAYINKDGSFR